MVAVLMSGSRTCWAQPVSKATRARRSPRAGVTRGQLWAGGTQARREVEHGLQGARHKRVHGAAQARGAQGKPEA